MLDEAVKMVEDVMSKNDGLEDVSSSTEDAYVEYTFKVEQDELLQYGLTTGQIVMMLSPTNTKDVLTTIEKEGNTLDVVVSVGLLLIGILKATLLPPQHV